MILVNDKQVEFTKFPDGTTSFRYNPFGSMTRIFNITWKYDGDEECILLWYLVNHIRDHDRDVRLRLLLPYIPNARMDRVKNADEVFTLKWFAQFINMLDFDDVLVDGKIERLELTSPEKVTDRNVLIVDDICSRGGTFTFTAKALKEAGANEVYLYVTHCENTIHSGTVLTDGLISRVFTTDSIYRGNSEMISLI